MIELAGGDDALGKKQSDSVRVSWNDIAAWAPEVLVVSPCGFATEKAVEQAHRLLQQPGWSDLPAVRNGRVFAVNANAYFSRPGPRVIDGVELLAHLLHPAWCAWNGPADAYQPVSTGSVQAPGVRLKQCPRCGARFPCGADAGPGKCWCDSFPVLSPPIPDFDCLCPECLAKALDAKKQ